MSLTWHEGARSSLLNTWRATRPSAFRARDGAFTSLVRSWPYALLVALALGSVLALGVNLSNAFPSEQKPFGWPGPAAFASGVAMVRDELILATALPALALAFVSVRRLDPRRDSVAFFGGVTATDLLLLAAGVACGAGLGAWAASKSSAGAYWAFVLAHVLLAWAFYALVALAVAALRGRGLVVALALFLFFVAAHDNLLQWRVFREAGYHRLQGGDFPDWFLAAQAASPVAAYRGTLILGWPAFMDGLENAVLKGAVLPPWANARTFSAALLSLWIILPLGLAASVWKFRAWWAVRPAPVPHAAPQQSMVRGPS